MLLARCCLWLALFLSPFHAFAQVSQNFLTSDLPQYELGAGAIVLNIPEYPGSKNNRYRVVPFPYYIYRGEYFRSDDEGTRARLTSSKFHELGFSFGFSFPVNSNDHQVRQGLPNLDTLVSFGPRLLLRLLGKKQSHRLNFTLSTRAAFSSKVSFNNLLRAEGFVIEPRLSYWYRWQESKTTLFSSLSIDFGSAKLNRFYYNVDPIYQTPTRPAYLAQAGAIQRALSLGLGQQISQTLFGFTGVSWRNFDWSANIESPLIATRNNVGGIVGIVWTFYESPEKVKIID